MLRMETVETTPCKIIDLFSREDSSLPSRVERPREVAPGIILTAVPCPCCGRVTHVWPAPPKNKKLPCSRFCRQELGLENRKPGGHEPPRRLTTDERSSRSVHYFRWESNEMEALREGWV